MRKKILTRLPLASRSKCIHLYTIKINLDFQELGITWQKESQ